MGIQQRGHDADAEQHEGERSDQGQQAQPQRPPRIDRPVVVQPCPGTVTGLWTGPALSGSLRPGRWCVVGAGRNRHAAEAQRLVSERSGEAEGRLCRTSESIRRALLSGGDGIDDAPALQATQVGLAVQGAGDVTGEAAPRGTKAALVMRRWDRLESQRLCRGCSAAAPSPAGRPPDC